MGHFSLMCGGILFDDVLSCCVLVCFQLREDFDMGIDVTLDEEHSVHDVAALLKEFLRHMPDPLLPRELYQAFLHANRMSLQLQKPAFTNHLYYYTGIRIHNSTVYNPTHFSLLYQVMNYAHLTRCFVFV